MMIKLSHEARKIVTCIIYWQHLVKPLPAKYRHNELEELEGGINGNFLKDEVVAASTSDKVPQERDRLQKELDTLQTHLREDTETHKLQC